jgi:Bacterial antitoxin of type II TA system, VapB
VRTTIRLDGDLLKAVRRVAHERGTTMTAVIEDALRRVLASEEVPEERPELPTYDGRGLQPGVDLDDSASLLDLMEQPDAPS